MMLFDELPTGHRMGSLEPLDSLQDKPKPAMSRCGDVRNNDQRAKMQTTREWGKSMQSSHRKTGKGMQKRLFWWVFVPFQLTQLKCVPSFHSLFVFWISVSFNITRILKLLCPSEWAEWDAWSACSTSVGRGKRRRKRDCIFLPTNQLDTFSKCIGKHKELGSCGG